MPDGGGFAKAMAGLRAIATPQAALRITQAIAQEAYTQVRLGFRESRDPYGNAWKAPSSRPGGKPLRDKGLLANSFSARVNGLSIVVGTNIPWAKTHQYGATIRPRTARMLAFTVKAPRLARSNKGRTQALGSYTARTFGPLKMTTKAPRMQSMNVFANQVTIPRRRMLPDRGMPRSWRVAFARAADKAQQAIMRRGV